MHGGGPGIAIVFALLPLACSGHHAPAAADTGDDAGASASGDDGGGDATTGVAPTDDASADAPVEASSADASDCDGPLPTDLACTGLYANVVAKTIAPGVRPFAPAFPLWSDGSGKERWIQLPPGTTIDRTSPSDWVFPVGTKLWKEFSRDGQRLETRFFHKGDDGDWQWVSYVWNPGESAATAAPDGQDIALEDGASYHVPTQQQCQECHDGRPEHVMGFEEVSLGMPGATGLTLAELAAEGLLVPAPARTALRLGDDGSGDAVQALGWMHINCGVPCHSAEPRTGAAAVGLHLRLDPTLLDGRPPAGFDSLTTTVGVTSSTGVWGYDARIAPGDPARSLVVELISRRMMGYQMPPLATVYVDTADVAVIEDWIARLPPLPPDAGVDGGDGGGDAGEAGDAASVGDDAGGDAGDAAADQ